MFYYKLILFLISAVLLSSSQHCGRGWVYRGRTHSCYSTAYHPLRWPDALNHCKQMGEGSNLVSVLSEQERVIVQDLIDDEFYSWVGLSRLSEIPPPSQFISDYDFVHFGKSSERIQNPPPSTESSGTDDSAAPPDIEEYSSGADPEAAIETSGEQANSPVFSWTDGSLLNFTFFQPDEPSDKGDCVAWSVGDDTNGWKTIACNYSQFFVCKKPARSVAPVVLTASSGEFSSPGYPSEYEDSMEQLYFIEVSENKRIMLVFDVVDTERDLDTITVYDGASERARTLTRISGDERDLAFLSLGDAVHIVFRSDDSSGGRGFTAHYEEWSEPAIIRLSQPGGVVSSVNYPFPVPPFTIQQYIIECPEQHHIHFNVTAVDTLPHDRLRFFTGSTSMHDVLRVFAGNSSKMPDFFRSPSESSFVHFKTVGGGQRSNGWRFGYDCVRLDGMGSEISID